MVYGGVLIINMDVIVACVFILFVFSQPFAVSGYIEYQLIRGDTEEKRQKGFKILKINCAIVSIVAAFLLLGYFFTEDDSSYILATIFIMLLGHLYHAYPTLVRRSPTPFKDVAVPGVRSFSKKVCLVWGILLPLSWIIHKIIY